MSTTPDRHPGNYIEDEFAQFTTSSQGDAPTEDGELGYVSGHGFRAKESGNIRVFLPYSNFSGSTAPTVNDDISKGYSSGSMWVDSTNQQAYVLLSPTIGNAVWKSITSGSTALSGSGISSNEHKTLRQLIHFINEGPGDGFYSSPFRETVGGNFPTRVTWWSDSNKTIKIFQTEITRSGIYPQVQNYKMYDSFGNIVSPIATDVIFYNGAFETARSRSFA